MPGARHAACTVEMASVTRAVDVAVVDEVQMLADGGRGHAFTRALLGLPARTLHLCGDAAVLPLLRQLVADAGESPLAASSVLRTPFSAVLHNYDTRLSTLSSPANLISLNSPLKPCHLTGSLLTLVNLALAAGLLLGRSHPRHDAA